METAIPSIKAEHFQLAYASTLMVPLLVLLRTVVRLEEYLLCLYMPETKMETLQPRVLLSASAQERLILLTVQAGTLLLKLSTHQSQETFLV